MEAIGLSLQMISHSREKVPNIYEHFKEWSVEINLQSAITAVHRATLANVEYLQAAANVFVSPWARLYECPFVSCKAQYPLATAKRIGFKLKRLPLIFYFLSAQHSGSG
jgi:hypothetical protein